MKTKRIKIYSFAELSETAKQKAIDTYRDSNQGDYNWTDENFDSMKAFAALFPITIKEASYGGRGEGVYFTFDGSDEVENLTGIRLAKYIWNNYKSDIYSYKYYSGTQRTKPNKYHKTNPAAPEFTTWSRHSKIIIEDYNCPLTGFYMDNEILDPIWKFLKKPDNRNFKELLKDCFNNWIKACNDERDAQDSNEYIAETIQANDYEFLADGRRYNY